MLLRFTIREGNCTDSLRVLSDTITVVVSTYCVHCIDVTYCYYRCHTYWHVCTCVCVSDTHRWALQKRLIQSRCCLVADSCGLQKPCVRWWSTLAPPDKHNWTIWAWQWCGLMSVYFDHLLTSGVMMGWLLRLVTGAPLVVGAPRQF